jgi:hypothetical protein
MIPSPIALRIAASTFIAAAWLELAEYVVKSVKGMCELKDDISVQTKDKRPEAEILAEVTRISGNDVWRDPKVHFKLTRDAIKASPEYTEEAFITRDSESGLFRHYGRDGYWAHETARTTSKQP